jgi:3-phosphoshikimate 1-carboxyvinyltransferase
LGRNAVIDGSGRLPERPIKPLTEQLNANGAVIGEAFPIHCAGKLKSGIFRTAGNISSQFISGLLLASPLTGGDCRIEITTALESKPYIDMTLSVMKQYDIAAEETEYGYFVKSGQKYTSPGCFAVEGDWSNAAFWLVAGALSGSGITCTNLLPDSLQGDKAVIGLLSQFSAKVTMQENALTVSPAPLKGIEIDAADIPDLVRCLRLPPAALSEVPAFTTPRACGIRKATDLRESARYLPISERISRRQTTD